MLKINKMSKIISLVLIFSILFLPIVEAAEKTSLFSKFKDKVKTTTAKIKAKTQDKVAQFKDKDWWKQKSISSSIGFVASQLGGGLGAALGYIAGAAIGGPLVAGTGAILGYRIGKTLTKVFGKAIGTIVARVKVKDKKKITFQTFKDALKSINLKKLSAEGTMAVIGDFAGGALGASIGISMLAGCGSFAIPILGTMTAAYIGGKIGKSIGRGLGKALGKFAGRKAMATSFMNEPKETTNSDTISSNPTDSESHYSPQATSNIDTSIEDKKAAYEKAYKEYVAISSGKSASQYDIQKAVLRYREAYDAYTAQIKGVASQN